MASQRAIGRGAAVVAIAVLCVMQHGLVNAYSSAASQPAASAAQQRVAGAPVVALVGMAASSAGSSAQHNEAVSHDAAVDKITALRSAGAQPALLEAAGAAATAAATGTAATAADERSTARLLPQNADNESNGPKGRYGGSGSNSGRGRRGGGGGEFSACSELLLAGVCTPCVQRSTQPGRRCSCAIDACAAVTDAAPLSARDGAQAATEVGMRGYVRAHMHRLPAPAAGTDLQCTLNDTTQSHLLRTRSSCWPPFPVGTKPCCARSNKETRVGFHLLHTYRRCRSMGLLGMQTRKESMLYVWRLR